MTSQNQTDRDYSETPSPPLMHSGLIIYFTRGKDGKERVCEVRPEEDRLKLRDNKSS